MGTRRKAEVCQVDVRRIGAPIEVGGMVMVRPWLLIIADETNQRTLGLVASPSPPTTEQVWQGVLQAISEPAEGEPHLPTEIRIRPLKKLLAMRNRFTRLGVRVSTEKSLPAVDRIVEDILEELAGNDAPGLLDMAGVTPKQVKALFEAAAAFYRQAPWKHAERPIKVEDPRFENPLYARLVSTPPGLVLSDRPDFQLENGQTADETSLLAVTFGEEDAALSPPDVEAVGQYQWEVAGRKAYPAVYRKEPNGKAQAPEAKEQEFLAAVLRALPEFVQGPKTREKLRVRAGKSNWAMVLTWA